jgi:hypothetical protein
MSNGTEFKPTNVIHKRCRKYKKESYYVIALCKGYGAVY